MLLSISSLVIYTVSAVQWDYSNTANWGDLDTLSDGWVNSCGSSFNTQSPIHIDPGNVNTCSSSDKLDWWINSEIVTFTVENNGHTIVVHPDDTNDYAKLKNNFKTDSGEHPDYKLGSLHIHWGDSNVAGSEHTISGKQTVLEMHFVHYSTDYDSLSDALNAIKVNADNKPTDEYILAVVGVLYTVGDENQFIKSIVDGISNIKNKDGTLQINDVNMSQIIPNVDGNNIKDDTKFYYYQGALTTPPCSPIVQWHVLQDTLTVSTSQLDALRKNIHNEDGELLENNGRPIQTNTNSVYYCGKF